MGLTAWDGDQSRPGPAGRDVTQQLPRAGRNRRIGARPWLVVATASGAAPSALRSPFVALRRSCWAVSGFSEEEEWNYCLVVSSCELYHNVSPLCWPEALAAVYLGYVPSLFSSVLHGHQMSLSLHHPLSPHRCVSRVLRRAPPPRTGARSRRAGRLLTQPAGLPRARAMYIRVNCGRAAPPAERPPRSAGAVWNVSAGRRRVSQRHAAETWREWSGLERFGGLVMAPRGVICLSRASIVSSRGG